jgi:hypothetical protein
MTRDQETEVRIPEIDRALRQGIGTADRERGAGLDILVRLVEARETGLQREYDRLSKVLPSTDPRLEGIALRLEAARALREEAAFEIARTSIGVPSPDKEAWTLYGLVRGAGPGLLEDKSVALADARGAIIAGTETPVEKDGRFLLRFKAPSRTGAEARQTPEVFVYLIDARRRAVYKDARALAPENGRVTYLEITLPAGRESRPSTPPRSAATEATETPPESRRTRRATPGVPEAESPPRRAARRPAQPPEADAPPDGGRSPR